MLHFRLNSFVRRSRRLVPCAPLFVLAFALLSPSPVRAQFTAGVDGRVSDPSDAPIPNAEVVVENRDTGFKRTVFTTEAGYYRIASLAAGVVTIRVSAKSFETAVAENLNLQSDQTKTFNIQLKVGAASTMIDVRAEVPLVETGEAKISNHIDTREVESLPLVGRNFMTLVVLTPGVTGLPSGGGQAYAQATGDIFAAEYGVNLNANGQRAESNSFLVDSASVNGSPRGGVTNYSPSADSIQEARISVNDFSAEYGRNSSAVVNVITKQGSNQFHGSAGWFHTNNRLQAHSVFQPTVPVFRRNEINGTVGGPIVKNKLFFFGSYDVLRSSIGSGSAASAITPEFSNYIQQNFANKLSAQIVKSFPNQLTKLSDGLTAGNIANQDCSKLAGGPASPITTTVGSLPCNFPVTFNGTFAQSVPRNGYQWNGRVDWNFHDGRDRIYFSIGLTDTKQTAFGGASVYPAFTTQAEEYTGHFNLNYTRIVSSTMVNEMSFSGTRAWGTDPVQHGEIPQINVTGIATYGLGFSDATFIQNNVEWRDVLSVNRGAHAFKFGGTWQCTSGCPGAGALFGAVWERPYFNFNNVFDFVNDNPFSETNIGFNPKTGASFGPDFKPRFVNFGVFANDDWKIRSNLTMSLGLRWEVFMNPTEENGLFVGATFPSGNDFASRIANLKPIQKQPLSHTDLNNFAPRVGIAWDPTGKGKMSVRTGFGVFYDRPGGQFFNDCCTTLPLFGNASVSKQTAPALPVYGFSSTTSKPWKFPAIPGLQIGLDQNNGLIGAPAGINMWDPNLRSQYSFNWFFGVQRSFANTWAVEGNYVGSQGRKLYSQYDVNRFDGDLIQNNGIQTRLNHSFGSINYGQSNGLSAYNGANFSVKNRFSRNLQMQFAYTVGKATDYSSSFSGTTPVDVSNLRLMRGPSSFDIRNKIALVLLYEIPGPHSGAPRALLGGWSASGFLIVQSGSPFSVYCGLPFSPVRNSAGAITGNSGCDFNADGINYDFVNAPSSSQRDGWSKQQWLSGAFKRADFPLPGLGQDGNLTRNAFVGPGYSNTNLTLEKKFRVGERINASFRSEFYNLFNQTNLTGIDSNISDSLFGHATSAFPTRNIQLGLKFTF